MADEIKELVPVVVPRGPGGKFLPGMSVKSPGRNKGSLDRITKLMREQFVAFAETHSRNANPLIGLATIAMDCEEPSAIRVRAWEVLLRHISPMLMKIEAEAPDQDTDAQITAVISVIKNLVKPDAR